MAIGKREVDSEQDFLTFVVTGEEVVDFLVFFRVNDCQIQWITHESFDTDWREREQLRLEMVVDGQVLFDPLPCTNGDGVCVDEIGMMVDMDGDNSSKIMRGCKRIVNSAGRPGDHRWIH